MTSLAARALDKQLDSFRWSKSELGMRFLSGLSDMQVGIEGTDLVGMAVRKILGQGGTYAVTDEIADVIASAAPTLPDFILRPDDLFTEHGFVMLESPRIFPDGKGNPVAVHAFGWSSVILTSPSIKERQPNGIVIQLWTDASHPEDSMMLNIYEERMKDNDTRTGQELMEEMRRMGTDVTMLPMFAGAWPWDEDDHATIPPGTMALRKFILTFLRFIEEPWIDGRYITPERPAVRRARRAGMPPEVRVVRLRRNADRPKGTGATPVLWSHRWIVEGHWRNQWYPSLKAHRPRWIPRHVKGPEDMPLLVKETVFQVDR